MRADVLSFCAAHLDRLCPPIGDLPALLARDDAELIMMLAIICEGVARHLDATPLDVARAVVACLRSRRRPT